MFSTARTTTVAISLMSSLPPPDAWISGGMALKKALLPGAALLPMNVEPPADCASKSSPNADAPPNTPAFALAVLLTGAGLSNRSATGSSDVRPNGLLGVVFGGAAKDSGLRRAAGGGLAAGAL